jgi:hypothetical protein
MPVNAEWDAGNIMLTNRWFILGVLFIARFILGFQFQSAGYLTLFIVKDFNIWL